MSEHGICRSMLAHVMEDVRKHATKEQMKEAWTWKDGTTGRQEFQMTVGTEEECVYWYGQACCGWFARYQGWCMFLRKKGVRQYQHDYDPREG